MSDPDRFADILHGELAATDGRVVYALEGDIDAASVPLLLARLNDLAGTHGRDVDLDLAGVSYMDSTGLGRLAAFGAELQVAGGMLRLRRISGAVRRLFDATEAHRLFQIADGDAG